MAETKNPGEDKTWEILATLKPDDVCRAAAVSYNPAAGVYTIRSFGMDFAVSLREKTITSRAAWSSVLLGKLGYFFRLSVLWYLVSAKDIACTGRPVKLQDIRGGDAFTRGAHALPLDSLAKKYGNNREGFVEKGTSLGGEIVSIGDAGLRLYPLPRVPVVIALWTADDEFPARADLLFDSTCILQIPPDIIWSVAMMSVLVMV